MKSLENGDIIRNDDERSTAVNQWQHLRRNSASEIGRKKT